MITNRPPRYKSNPIRELRHWLDTALNAGIFQANAMVLATASRHGHPSTRTVLLKEIKKNGPVFFTNYESRKGKELNKNPYAAATIYWKELGVQINLEGPVKKISRAASVKYFNQRPRGSQISAYLSRQSTEVSSREFLEEEFGYYLQIFREKNKIPCPSNWGGYLLMPDRIEFWYARENRLHDRFLFLKESGNSQRIKKIQKWKMVRLYP